MDNKTNRGKLVRKYIGEEIEKFKFEYKGYQNDSWKYERKFKGVIQTISIYPYRFDQRMITFELYTDVKNSAYASEMGTNVIQAGMIEDITTNSEMRGYWKYDTEDELIEVLNDMKDVLMKKGMRILVQLSKGEEETDTAEMYHELYFNHDELCEKFIKKTGIKATDFDEKNIKVIVHIINGLPGEDYNMMMETAKAVANMGVDGIKIHLLHVIKDTPMEKMLQKGMLTLMNQEEYINLVCDQLEILPETMIVHRLTGDGKRDELVGPLWSLKKWEVLNDIDKTLKERDTYQGIYYNKK